MIRGAGRLQRMDERAAFPTPGGDAVRDGRHLFENDGGIPDETFEQFVTAVRENKYGRVRECYCIIRFGLEYFQTPADADLARMEGEGGVSC